MHPMIIEAVGVERSRDLQERAAASRQARDSRRAARPRMRNRRALRSLRVPATA